MNTEEKLLQLIKAKTAAILTANEYTTGKNYETNAGNVLKDWLGIDVDELNEGERLEIRDPDGEAVDDERPLGKQRINIEFAYTKSLKLSEITATEKIDKYLRKVQADIYRMIGSNITYFRAQLNNYSLVFRRGKWMRNIDTTNKVYAEQSVEIIVEYNTTDEWLINEPEYT